MTLIDLDSLLFLQNSSTDLPRELLSRDHLYDLAGHYFSLSSPCLLSNRDAAYSRTSDQPRFSIFSDENTLTLCRAHRRVHL